jgi:hypothetical protein
VNIPSLTVIPRTFATLLERILGGASYVKTGLAVTAVGAGSTFVAVASGTAVVDGTPVSYIGGTVDVGPADSNPRYDLVVILSGGSSPSKVAGTPSNAPIPPALPAGALLLGLTYLPASATDFTSGGFVADYTVAMSMLKLTTKGDILTFSTVPVRKAVGTNGHILSANSAQADGLEWIPNNAADAHIADGTDAHDASAISILDAAGDFTATEVEGALAELQSDNEAHVAAADPHAGYLKETDFDDIDFLVGTATGHTGAEIVVGTTPGGELGNTWASPTVDTVHSGSAHHAAPTLATEQATTSGTVIDFTGIPAGVKKIIVMFVGFSTSGTSLPLIQIGDSGGIEATGYVGSVANNGAQAAALYGGAGFAVSNSWLAAGVYSGRIELCLEDSADNTWVAHGGVGAQTGTASVSQTAGSKALSAVLDRVRITTTNGTDTFDAGAVNIMYE